MSAVLQINDLRQTAAVSPERVCRALTILVAGNPNAGKTSLFNSLTGLRQKVANYPGVTVESKSGLWPLAPQMPPARVIDLPGLYSLDATSLDEEIARDILLGRAASLATPDVIVVAVDATNLVRNLYLASQLIDTGQRVVIALTMFDRVERSQLAIDAKKLGDALGVAVVPVVAKRRRGLAELSKAVLAAMTQGVSAIKTVELSQEADQASRHSKLIKRYAFIERIVSDVAETRDHRRPNFSEKIDRVVTHRIFGPVIL